MGVAILHRVAREVLTHKVRFEQRPGRKGRRNEVAPPGGRTFQAERIVGTKIVRLEYAWHVPRSAGRLGWLDGRRDESREEKKTEGSWGQTLSGCVGRGKGFGLYCEWDGVL